MTLRLGELDLKDAAKIAAGNWQRFPNFVWSRATELEKPEDWAVFYTHHQGSELLVQSNAASIRSALVRFTCGRRASVVFESHSHWAVRSISGFSIRVFSRKRITRAFQTYHALTVQLEQYPILDETDYSDREYAATCENIVEIARRLSSDFVLPDEWQYAVYDWLSFNREHAVENIDDEGGYPDTEDIVAAFTALGYRSPSEQIEHVSVKADSMERRRTLL